MRSKRMVGFCGLLLLSSLLQFNSGNQRLSALANSESPASQKEASGSYELLGVLQGFSAKQRIGILEFRPPSVPNHPNAASSVVFGIREGEKIPYSSFIGSNRVDTAKWPSAKVSMLGEHEATLEMGGRETTLKDTSTQQLLTNDSRLSKPNSITLSQSEMEDFFSEAEVARWRAGLRIDLNQVGNEIRGIFLGGSVKNSSLGKIGLQDGDVVLSIGNQVIRSYADAISAINFAVSQGHGSFRAMRAGREFVVAINENHTPSKMEKNVTHLSTPTLSEFSSDCNKALLRTPVRHIDKLVLEASTLDAQFKNGGTPYLEGTELSPSTDSAGQFCGFSVRIKRAESVFSWIKMENGDIILAVGSTALNDKGLGYKIGEALQDRKSILFTYARKKRVFKTLVRIHGR